MASSRIPGTSLYRTSEGPLCSAHATTGAPKLHTPGCKRCEEARAKGIKRPDAPTGSRKKRWSENARLVVTRDGVVPAKRIDWSKINRPERVIAPDPRRRTG